MGSRIIGTLAQKLWTKKIYFPACVVCFNNDSMESTKVLYFSYIKCISTKNRFIIIGTLDSHESFSIICDEIREYIWSDFWPFLHAESFRIITISVFVCVWTPLFSLDQRCFMGFKSGDWYSHWWTWILFLPLAELGGGGRGVNNPGLRILGGALLIMTIFFLFFCDKTEIKRPFQINLWQH